MTIMYMELVTGRKPGRNFSEPHNPPSTHAQVNYLMREFGLPQRRAEILAPLIFSTPTDGGVK
jgi:hypothetical protein